MASTLVPATVINPTATPVRTPSPTATPPGPSGNPNQQASQSRFPGCSGTGRVNFANSPMRAEDILHMLPYGMLAGAHVTPIDHMYFEPFDRALGRDVYEVRAVQDGVIYSMQPRDVNVDTGQAKQREWRMDIAHSCTFTSYFDLLTSLDPALEVEWNKTQGGRTGPWKGIQVKAGQVVGRIGAQTLDFGAYDYDIVLPGFIVPAHYNYEIWKVHTVDPFPYFPPEVRETLLAKMLRKVEPRAGKIDHDVDGTLAGNWFQQGTNGYAGLTQSKYWDGHLAIVPDALDPTQWRFSTGNFSGQARQFGVKGNAPDPRNVTIETGLVKYELTQFSYYAANDPARNGLGSTGVRAGDDVASRNMDQVLGVALVQMTGTRTLKCELFPGKTAAEVTGFTAAAKVFER